MARASWGSKRKKRHRESSRRYIPSANLIFSLGSFPGADFGIDISRIAIDIFENLFFLRTTAILTAEPQRPLVVARKISSQKYLSRSWICQSQNQRPGTTQ